MYARNMFRVFGEVTFRQECQLRTHFASLTQTIVEDAHENYTPSGIDVGIVLGFEELTHLSQRYYVLEKHSAVFPWESAERSNLYPHLSPVGYSFFAPLRV